MHVCLVRRGGCLEGVAIIGVVRSEKGGGRDWIVRNEERARQSSSNFVLLQYVMVCNLQSSFRNPNPTISVSKMLVSISF